MYRALRVRSHRGVLSLLGVALLMMTSGCMGSLGDREGGAGRAEGVVLHGTGGDVAVDPNRTLVDENGVPVDENGAALCIEGTRDVGPTGQWRLSHAQYENAMSVLLNDRTSPAGKFPADAGGIGEDGNRTVTVLLAENYESAAYKLAVAATLDVEFLTGCSGNAQDRACADSFTRTFGGRSFRRPMEDGEVEEMLALYDLGRTENGTFAHGIEMIIRGILQSVYFLYRVEFGTTPKAGEDVVPLTDYEMATRLSFFFHNTIPDDTLVVEADAGRPSTLEEIRVQAERLLASDESRKSMRMFFDTWLDLSHVAEVNRVRLFYDTVKSSN